MLNDAKVEQMASIIGNDVSRERLANVLDGAGGNVQVALEHYFMSLSSAESSASASASASATAAPHTSVLVAPSSLDDVQAHVAQPESQRRPMSALILPIPAMNESIEAPGITQVIAPALYDTQTALPPAPASATTLNDLEVLTPFVLPPPPLSSTMSVTTRSVRGESIDDAWGDASSVYSDSSEHESLTIHDFEMLSVLGKGSFGAVMLVRFKKDGRVFALKIIKKTNMDRTDIMNAMEERQILQRIHHPYICSLVFAFQTNERLYLGMKYYAAGDLFYHLNMRGKIDLRDVRLYGAELVLAISYLHELNILYRDLKPSNVMIDADGHIGVVDFGLSKQHIYGSSYGVKTLSGTAEYVAPEALAQNTDGTRNYGKAYDWWSLGIVIVRSDCFICLGLICCVRIKLTPLESLSDCNQYEMLVGESPFYDENEHKMLSRIAYADVVFPRDFPKDAYDLVRGLLTKDPYRRLGSADVGGVEAIKANAFFRTIDWEALERREVTARWKPKLSSDTDTRYVDPEFIDEGPPSAAYDPSIGAKKSHSKRFSQFSFNYNLR